MAQLIKNPAAMKETSYNAGYPGLIPGSERAPGDEDDKLLQ